MPEQENGPKTQGRVAAYLGWALFALGVLAFVGMFGIEKGYPFLEGTPAQIIGLWLGLNGLTLCAFLLASYAGIARKNRSGRVLLAASGFLLAVSTALSIIPWDSPVQLGDIEFVTSHESEFEVAFPQTYIRKMAYVQELEVVAYETKDGESPYLRVEFTPLADTGTQVPDMRTMLEKYAHLAGLDRPEITVAQEEVGRVGTYSGVKTVDGVELRVYGKVVAGQRSMVSCVVVESLSDFPSSDSTLLLGSIRQK